MRLSRVVVSAGAALAAIQGVGADLCKMGSQEIDGNRYCQDVQAIQYSNVGTAGTYNQITNMASDGSCSSQPKNFAGPLSPLDEEVSFHFRGPLHLKQFAAYTPVTSGQAGNSKRDVHQHNHQHVHNHYHAKEKHGIHHGRRRLGKRAANPAPQDQPSVMVTATIDGQVVSWVNNWFGDSPSQSITDAAATAVETSADFDSVTITTIVTVTITTDCEVAAESPTIPLASSDLTLEATTSNSEGYDAGASSMPAPPASPSVVDTATFKRVGYYDSASQTVDNLVFLGNYGGQGSGVFDYNFGASLAYSNCNGTGGASSSEILEDRLLPSNSEVVVMLGQECQGDSCGYVRPNSIAYHGFDGADKIFLMEFLMPMDGTSGFNSDMPAIWLLNAQIPRTVQYGKAECSCWATGCGEFDIAEALASGSKFLKSTLHANPSAGDSDYFLRPTTDIMKLAVIFQSANSTIYIEVLPDNTDFSTELGADDVNKMVSASSGKRISLFQVS